MQLSFLQLRRFTVCSIQSCTSPAGSVGRPSLAVRWVLTKRLGGQVGEIQTLPLPLFFCVANRRQRSHTTRHTFRFMRFCCLKYLLPLLCYEASDGSAKPIRWIVGSGVPCQAGWTIEWWGLVSLYGSATRLDKQSIQTSMMMPFFEEFLLS